MACENAKSNYCNENVHNIVEKMMQGQFKEDYIGGLFNDPEYPTFEKLEECIQYLQEYVPLHLPQIEKVLETILPCFINPARPIKILDYGSGPATVALAFCRLLPRLNNKHRLKITTVETSEEFNNMINIFRAENANESIKIAACFKYGLLDDRLMDDKSIFQIGHNWIIMANVLSAIGKDMGFKEVNGKLNRFIYNMLLYSRNVLLTIVETSTITYFNAPDYLSKIETIGFDNLKIIGTTPPVINERIDAPWIMNCKFYRTGNDCSSPIINSKSLLLGLK